MPVDKIIFLLAIFSTVVNYVIRLGTVLISLETIGTNLETVVANFEGKFMESLFDEIMETYIKRYCIYL